MISRRVWEKPPEVIQFAPDRNITRALVIPACPASLACTSLVEGGRVGSEMSGRVKSAKVRVHSISRGVQCADVRLLARRRRPALRPAFDELRGKMIFALLFKANEGETWNLLIKRPSSDLLTSQQVKAPVMRLLWKPQQDPIAHLVSSEILMLLIHTAQLNVIISWRNIDFMEVFLCVSQSFYLWLRC